MGEHILVILYFYGDSAIFLLLYDNQDTKYELRELEIGVTGPIFTHKNFIVYMGHQYTYITGWEKNIVEVIHIFGAS